VTRVLIEGTVPWGWNTCGRPAPHLRATAEVILSGGAINSPQLLHAVGHRPGALLQGPGPAGGGGQPQCRRTYSDHQGINYTWKMKVPTYNNILRPWGKALMGMWYLADRRRAAGQVDQPWRRLLPHPAGPRPPEHAALLPGLFHPAAQGPANGRC
jgi:choline dehydrogenase